MVLSAALVAGHLPGRHATAWHWFDDAARLLRGDTSPGGPGGLSLYADNPGFQFGPVSIVASLPFSLLGGDLGPPAAMAACQAMGLVAFGLLAAAARCWHPRVPARTWHRVTLVGGAVFVVTWADVAARTAHIDDALALVATAAAVWTCARHPSWWPTAALVALAAAAKPWAAAFAPLVLVPRLGPAWWWRLAAVATAVALTWAPFVLAEPATLDAARHRIVNDPTSVLRALGVGDPFTPGWVRPTQLAGGLALAWLVALRGAWPAVVLAGVSWRLLLDPAANRYYTIGFVLGALVVHLWRRPERLPWAVVGTAVVLEATAMPDFPALAGRYLRLAVVAGGLVVAGWLAVRRGTEAPRPVAAPPAAAGATPGPAR